MEVVIPPQEQRLGQHDVQDRARAYKSRNKRPCDFCRYKKAACHLEHKPPCELCLRYGKDCTFVESPAKRRRPNTNEELPREPLVPPSNFDLGSDLLSWEPLPSFMTASLPGGLPGEYKFDSPMFAPLMFEQFDPVQAGLAPPSSRSTRTQSVESIPTSFFDNAQEPSLDVQGSSNAQVVGLSGERDPFLLRHFICDGNNECIFQKHRLRRVGENDKIPVHFLIQPNELATKAQPVGDQGMLDNFRREIKNIVHDDIGKRLIRMYVFGCFHSRASVLTKQILPFCTAVLSNLVSRAQHEQQRLRSRSFPNLASCCSLWTCTAILYLRRSALCRCIHSTICRLAVPDRLVSCTTELSYTFAVSRSNASPACAEETDEQARR